VPNGNLGRAVPAIPILSVFMGAGCGACVRWWLGLRLNPLLPTLPPEARLFVITGLLGGLTTFSTFSSEVVGLLANAQFEWAAVAIGAHMLGSFGATAVGMMTTHWLFGNR
jgi:CrcB protein